MYHELTRIINKRIGSIKIIRLVVKISLKLRKLYNILEYYKNFDHYVLAKFSTFQSIYFDALQARSKFLKSWKTKVVNQNFLTKHFRFTCINFYQSFQGII